jgi:prolipoprotein diacylglyceryl transferase
MLQTANSLFSLIANTIVATITQTQVAADNFSQFMHWDISPTIGIFEGGPLQIRWYGLFFALSFVLGYQIMQYIFQKEGKNLKDLESLTLTMILGTVLGARLGHCLFYSPEYYLSNPLEILKIWEGGLASHGAMLGIPFALWIFSRKHKDFEYFWIIDRIVIVVALSGFFIRMGNFFNSEIVGKVTDVPWAIVFSRIDEMPRQPSQIYEAVTYLFIFMILAYRYVVNNFNIAKGKSLGLFLMLIFGARFFWEFTKENQVDFESALPLNMGQLLSIPAVLVGAYLFFIFKSQKNEIINTKQSKK